MSHKKLNKEELYILIDEIAKGQKMECERCASRLEPTKRLRYLGICINTSCKHRQSLWAQTVFACTKLDKLVFLRILEFWCIKTPSKCIAYILEISEQTVSRVLSILETRLYERNEIEVEKIGGEGIIVEIDESKFGKRKYHRGHRVEGVWVFGMVERTPERRIRLVAVDDRSAETLMDKLSLHVDPNSIILSDKWRGYKDVIRNFADHLTVNHSLHYVDPATGVHTNTIEGNWNGVKMNVASSVRRKNKITIYLTRYMISRNNTCHPLRALLKLLH